MSTAFFPSSPKSIGYDRETRDYMASYDGNVIGFFPNYSQAEEALNDYVLHLCQEGLIDAPLGVLDPAEDDDRPEPIREPLDQERSGVDEPEEDDDEFAGPAYHAPGYCGNCGGPHHVQRCPKILTALRAAPIPAVRTTARQWLADDWRRDAIARQWSEALRQQMDASAESYAGITKAHS